MAVPDPDVEVTKKLHMSVDLQDYIINLIKNTVLDKYFPIGSIYISTYNINPSESLGGVWEQIKDRFLLSSGDTYHIGDTGGEATHKLTVDEIPSHNHRQTVTGSRAGGGSTYVSWNANNLTGNTDKDARNTLNTGGGKAHNNMPPYIVVSVWKRIS